MKGLNKLYTLFAIALLAVGCTQSFILDATTVDKPSSVAIGDIITVGGVKGIVFQTTPNVKLVSTSIAHSNWGESGVTTGATDANNGANNMLIIQSLPDWESNYPAFKWCADLGTGWYMPSYSELKSIYSQSKVLNAGYLDKTQYWSSTEYNSTTFYSLSFATGTLTTRGKNLASNICAVVVLDESLNPVPLEKNSSNTSKIYYTSTDGKVVTPYPAIFGANVVSNTYENGQGVITFDGTVTSIGDSAFYNCSSLTSITIPDSVTSIGNSAFLSCSSLTSVYCKSTTPPTLGGTYTFDYNAIDRKIYVLAASVDAYKSANYWSEYASAIMAE